MAKCSEWQSPDDAQADTTSPELEILARPGGNDKVIGKKVLLSHLAAQEAARLGILPDAGDIQALADHYCRDLGLFDPEAVGAWLAQAGLRPDQFLAVIADFAAVLAVERHHQEPLAARVQLHRRVLEARNRRLAERISSRDPAPDMP